MEKITYVLYGNKEGRQDWEEDLITEATQEEKENGKLEDAKKWAKNNGWVTFRIARHIWDGSMIDFKNTINI